MKSIINILANSSTITDQLADGADSIMAIREVQGAQKPYVVVDFRLSDPNDTFDDQRLTEYDIDLTVVSDRVFDIGSFIGCQDLANDIRDVLHGESGNYGGEDVVEIVYQGEDQPVPVFVSDKQEFEITQQYKVYIDRVQKTIITAATYSNQDQIVTSGDTMANMAVTLTPLAATARFSVVSGSLPTNTTLNSTTGAITQSAAAAEDVYSWTVKVQGYGEYTGVVYVTCTMSVQAAASGVTISAITYTNANQTVWVGTADAQNQGAPVTSVPDNPNETGTFATVAAAPAGVSVHATTGVVTYTFASLASGASTFTVRKTGTGNYTGTQDYSITITKRTRWNPKTATLETATIRTDASWNLYNDEGDITESAGEVSAIKNYAGTTWTQGTVASRMQTKEKANDRTIVVSSDANNRFTSNVSDLSATFTFWMAGVFQMSSVPLYILGSNNTNYLASSSTTPTPFQLRVGGGTILNFTTTLQNISLLNGSDIVVKITYSSGAHVCKIWNEDGLILSLTNTTVENNTFTGTGFAVGTPTGSNGSQCHYQEIITTTGAESVADQSNLSSHLLYNAGLASTPPFV